MARLNYEGIIDMFMTLQRKFALFSFVFQCLLFLRDETLSNNYQLEAVSELSFGFDFKP